VRGADATSTRLASCDVCRSVLASLVYEAWLSCPLLPLPASRSDRRARGSAWHDSDNLARRVSGRGADGWELFDDSMCQGRDDQFQLRDDRRTLWDNGGHLGTGSGNLDDAPYTDDLDLGAVSTRADLAARLRLVHLRADNPSLRTLEMRTRHSGTPLSRTSVADMLKGARFPRKAVMVAFLRACGVPDDKMDPWQRTWERVASREEGPTRHGKTQATASHQGQASAAQPSQSVGQNVESEMQAQWPGADRLTPEDNTSADATGMSQPRGQIKEPAQANEQLRSGSSTKRRPAANQPRPDDLASEREARNPITRPSMWHFPDRTQITLVSYRLPPNQRPSSSDPSNPNYVRFADLADLDTLIDIYGAVRAYNPQSRVVIMAAQDLAQQDVATHLVLIGGLTWEAVTPWFSRIFSIPIQAGDPFDRGAIVVRDPANGEREFAHTLSGKEVVEDVGFFASGENPSAPRRRLMICGGITTRGVRGAALCFIDLQMRERNEQYVLTRFPKGSTYCIVMRVPIMNKDPLPPDLSKKENRLFEWCAVNTKAE